LGRSFQGARLFPSITVADAIAVALEPEIASKSAVAALLWAPQERRSEIHVRERVDELIELFHLEAFANKFVSELSTGTRRVVELTCAMAQMPDVLLLDEPSSGIAQRETEALGPLLREIRDRTGAAMVVIEHDMTLVRAVADELVAVDQGVVIARGDPDSVLSDPAFVAAYLGSSEATIRRSGRRMEA
jgi:branched-chain amino acid transport system ATP-binding protein